MGKRLTADESFKCYQLVKAAAHTDAAGDLYQFTEDFFCDINDYDRWDEGDEEVVYVYPWGARNAARLKEYGIVRKGQRIYLHGAEVTYAGGVVYLDGTAAAGFDG